mgnify:CR=1 FL=1
MLAAPLAALVALAGLAFAQSSSSSGSQTSSAAVPVSTAAVPGCALTCVLSTLPSSPVRYRPHSSRRRVPQGAS